MRVSFWKKPLFWLFFVGFVFTAGALLVIFTGKVEVDPARVLNPTNFDSSRQVGAVIFRRFWQELHKERLIIIGSHPFLREYDNVWRGFISVAKENDVYFSRVFAQENLRELIAGAEALKWEDVQIALASPGYVLVHVIATEEMLQQVRERTMGGFVIFQSLLPVTDAEKNVLQSECKPDVPTLMACRALKSLNVGKKKKFDPNKLTVIIEKHGAREHLLYIHEAPN